MEHDPAPKQQREPTAVRDQLIAGLLGPLKIEVNRLETDPFVIAMLKRAGVKLLPDYGD